MLLTFETNHVGPGRAGIQGPENTAQTQQP